MLIIQGVAKTSEAKIPNSVILNQYSNFDNPLAHELTTGPEIIEAIIADAAKTDPTSRKTSGKVDAVISSAGTGGTITGISRAIKKEHNPQCCIVGVDPVSLLSICLLQLLKSLICRKEACWLCQVASTPRRLVFFIRWKGSGKSGKCYLLTKLT